MNHLNLLMMLLVTMPHPMIVQCKMQQPQLQGMGENVQVVLQQDTLQVTWQVALQIALQQNQSV
jgi:hypothetical protein